MRARLIRFPVFRPPHHTTNLPSPFFTILYEKVTRLSPFPTIVSLSIASPPP